MEGTKSHSLACLTSSPVLRFPCSLTRFTGCCRHCGFCAKRSGEQNGILYEQANKNQAKITSRGGMCVRLHDGDAGDRCGAVIELILLG